MLTKRQGQVLGFIREYLNANGYAPTHQEIADALGLRSLATVSKHLSNLTRDGYITRRWNSWRGIELCDGTGACSKCGRPFGGSGTFA